MTNADRKNYLFKEAEKEYKDMNSAWIDKDWNRVIRKAQETIECYLKGILKFLNIEFPKEHDIGKYFVQTLIERKIQFDVEFMEKVKELSEELAKKRAPAYYGDEFYSEEEALEAKQGAEQVRDFASQLIKKLATNSTAGLQ